MPLPQVLLTVDLGYGDSGKGTIVDSLVRQYNAPPIVVRYSGGAQAGHNVVYANGHHHCYSQFGAGALYGCDTVLLKDVIIDPVRMYNEGTKLQQAGLERPSDKILIDSNCLVATPFHAALNRIREAARGKDAHGSCGIGIGETRAYALKYPDRALRAKDLHNLDVAEEKLHRIREDLGREIVDLESKAYSNIGSHDLGYFTNKEAIPACLWRYHTFAKTYKLIWSTELLYGYMSKRNMVFEASQGVLLDENVGFHPYTTWSDVTLRPAIHALDGMGITDYQTTGILRVFANRHGAGPFPTEDAILGGIIGGDKYNPFNQWQKYFRIGWFDVVASLYAITCAGAKIDNLALTHLDHLTKRDKWKVAMDYPLKYIPSFDLDARERQTAELNKLGAEDVEIVKVSGEEIPEFIATNLGLPLSITSHGPTSKHKSYRTAVSI